MSHLRHPFWIAQALALSVPTPAQAATQQYDPASILTGMPMSDVRSGRLMCASGIRGDMVNALGKALGERGLPRIGAECLAYMIRYARLGQFGGPPGLKDNRSPVALAVDASFMSAYSKQEPPPVGLPGQAVLVPIVDRCMRGLEPDAGLCTAAGYGMGARLAAGEPLAA